MHLLNGRVAGAAVNGRAIAPAGISVRGAVLRVRRASGALFLAPELDPRGTRR